MITIDPGSNGRREGARKAIKIEGPLCGQEAGHPRSGMWGQWTEWDDSTSLSLCISLSLAAGELGRRQRVPT